MTPLELALLKTRKNILEVVAQIGYNYDENTVLSIKQCNCCGIWLKNLEVDLDGLDICSYCVDEYGK